MTGSAFIAIDWGTTNRRTFLIEAGAVVRSSNDGQGASTLSRDDFPSSLAAVRADFGELPVIMAGMVGANIGWREVPYVAAPAGLEDLVGGIAWIDARTAIVPGLSYRDGDRADVMRGEEVQLLGAMAAKIVPADALLCQPGTHCKWAVAQAGRITAFVSTMTGELFALLRQHSLLARQLTGQVSDDEAFREGVREGSRRDLAASLFAVRASGVLGLRNDAAAASFVSGLLIGADVAARLDEHGGGDVHILASSSLGTLYARAIGDVGGSATIVDADTGFVAGITRLRNLSS